MNRFLAAIEGVSETLLIPLAARANAPRFCPDLGFRDPFAEGLAYRWRQTLRRFEDDLSSMRGCCLRAACAPLGLICKCAIFYSTILTRCA